MTPTELGLAREWRAYVGSFIRKGEYVLCLSAIASAYPSRSPNKEKLKTAPTWYHYGKLDYENSPLRLVPSFHFESNPEDTPTTTQMEVVGRPQLQRIEYFLSEKIQEAIHN